ncbi:ArsR/SmtB family transcription factor [Oceanisphaera sp.]|uniref:ArsR/SmtB family transcription factor n=1 Tax=Oceanisphaera sp. TaxID=1929979 RepID=UPI003A8E0007
MMEFNMEAMEASAAQAVKLLKALANERRLFILCHLLDKELSVGEMNQHLGLSQSALSQHLALLRNDDLVQTRKEAQTVYYSLKSDEVREMITLLHKLYCREG